MEPPEGALSVAEEAIEDGLTVVDDATYFGILGEEAAKKLKTLGGELTPESQRKLYSFLSSRGYSAAEIGRAIDNGLPEVD